MRYRRIWNRIVALGLVLVCHRIHVAYQDGGQQNWIASTGRVFRSTGRFSSWDN